MIAALLFSFILLALTWCIRKNFTYWRQYKNVVASVPGRIFSGNLFDYLRLKTNFGYHLKAIYDDPKFANEPFVGIYGFYKPSLLLREPELIKSVLIKDFDCFRDRLSTMDPHIDPIGGNMMVFLRYNAWKDIRSKLTPIFSSGKLKFMYPLIQKVGENMEQFLRAQPKENRMEMKNFCGRYTTDVTATTMFGFCSNSLQNPEENVYLQVRKMASWNWKRTIDTLVVFFVPKLNRILKSKFFFEETNKFFAYTFDYMLAERERTGEKRNDLIDIFVKLKQEAVNNGEDVQKLRDLLLAQLCVFLAAGFETSSTTMSNVLLELAKNPEMLKKLREDIRQAFIEGKGEIAYEVLINMEYLDMLIHETLRVYPVLPLLDRKYSDPSGEGKPYSLKPYSDFSIPEGMPVYISPYALNYDPQYFPNPTRFDPERFSAENKRTRHPMVSLPFGNGPHNCIGYRLGLLQIKTGLVYMLRNCYVRVCDETVLQPEFDAKAIILQVKGGINLEIVQDNMCDNARSKIY